jgi:4-amino-4-deoxy-L-arabinose transferase-like glycosyltransferase
VRPRLLLLIPVLGAAALYLPCAAGRAILDVDEALYVEAPQEMLARHDWVTPYVNGVRFVDKPPLLYWVLAGLYRILGTTEFAAHLPPALAVVATTWLLTGLARRVAGPLAGLAGGVSFALSAGTYLFTRETLHDGLMVFFMVLAMDAFFRWSADPGRPTVWVLVFSAAVAGGLLSKGLIGIAFPCLIATVVLVLSRERPGLRPGQALLGASVVLLLAMPWHVLASLRNPGFFRHYVLNEQLLRFVNRREPQDFESIPLPLFLALLLVWLFPWSAFLPAIALGHERFVGDVSERPRLARLCLVWTAVVLVFFSVSARLEHYAFPVLPPLALLTGLALSAETERIQRAAAWGFRALAGLGVLIGAVGVGGALWIGTKGLPAAGSSMRASPLQAAGTDFGPLADLPAPVVAQLLWPAAGTAAALAIGLVGAGWLDSRGRRVGAILTLTSAMAAFGVLAHASLRICEDVVSSKRFGVALAGLRLRPGDHVVVVGDYETANSMSFYAPPRLEIVEGRAPTLAAGLRDPDAPKMVLSRADLQRIWNSEGRACVLSPEDRLGGLGLASGFEPMRSLDRVLVCNRSPSR